RAPGAALGALAAALERSRRYGSPLAAPRPEHASTPRLEEWPRTAHRAARAAPKTPLGAAPVLRPPLPGMIRAALSAPPPAQRARSAQPNARTRRSGATASR